ncbi:bZIP transcription factor [Phlyctema vagabunda]|uniref:BZIP transcription factor n=1 Tax=Phlyctema vagabunda TaxID=108571 RepID=A0ABR4P5T3_9HELO
MAAFSMQHYYRPSPLTVETAHHSHNYFEEDEGSILDENILDNSGLDSGLEMSPPMNGSRRESFAVSSALFSPKTDEWQHVDMQPMASNNPFVEQNNHHNNNNPFMRIDAQAANYGHPNHAWNLNQQHSGMNTPMQVHDGMPQDYEVNAPVFQRPMQTPFSNPGNQQLPLFSSSTTSNGSIPASPQKDWSVAEAMESRGMNKRMRPHSPTLRSHPDMSRRSDGIRKKNARFDIPVERNLLNIDQLISQSTDEQEIKELKQQKRLLRNRQAALDSRQRKKLHTERLEDEKKAFATAINDLEEDLAEHKLKQDGWARKEQQYQQYIENMQFEKEEMIRAHTIETGDLRKKISVLTEHMQKMEVTAMSTLPSSTGFSADYADIDSLTMDGAWDNISFLNDYTIEPEVKVETAIVPTKKEVALVSEPEKPAAQGLLLMLLLFGAFVASKGSSSIPTMSDDVREASATLLEDIFKDAGVPQTASGIADAVAPHPSGNSWSTTATTNPRVTNLGGNNNMVGVTSSRLGDLVDSLSQPTEQQHHEQVFSLSAAQYSGLTSHDFLQNTPPPSTSQGRRNLGESLAAMRSDSKNSAAEVNTRSLLWDQVPSEVVRNFAKLVSECNSRNGENE